MHITVLGVGLVGNAIVRDLASEEGFEITAVDRDPDALGRLAQQAPVHTLQADLQAEREVHRAVANADLVICAVPGFMGFETLRQVIEAGKSVVDISFFPEDPFVLDELAQAQGVTAVVDCGVAPGLSNIIAGYMETQLDRVVRYVCYVGGLPQIRRWPYEYQVVFSPVDVLEIYVRPARYVEYGQEVTRPALSDVELVDLPGIGTLEAFNTDGLRTLARTLDAPFMKEKTLRYPGHANLMRIFRESGFFDADPVVVDGASVRPVSLTAQLLFRQWQLEAHEPDLTVMRVIIEGEKDGRLLRYTYDLLDHHDAATQTHSMARTTGYTATIVARQVIKGLFDRTGICPPEFVGRTPGCWADLMAEYARRNINLTATSTEIPS